MANDVFNQFHWFVKEGLTILSCDLPFSPLPLVFVGDVIEIIMLIPVPGLFEMLIREAGLIRVSIDTQRQKDVVEALPQS